MPYADPEQQRRYQRERIARLRAAWFAGKRCANCGITEHLELDHIDPGQKVSHNVWSWSDTRRAAELAKCQVLCRSCHQMKSRHEKRPTRGEQRSNRKLNDATVRIIRSSSKSNTELAAQYGISRETAWRIKRGIDWAHVT